MNSGSGLGIGGDTDWMEWKSAPNVQLANNCDHCAYYDSEDDQLQCMNECLDAYNKSSSFNAGQVTRFASSLKSPAADEGICDTDAYSCFYLAGDQTRQPALTSDVQQAYFPYCQMFPWAC